MKTKILVDFQICIRVPLNLDVKDIYIYISVFEIAVALKESSDD